MTAYRVEVRRGTEVLKTGTAWFAAPDLLVTAFHVVGADGRWLTELDPTIELRLPAFGVVATAGVIDAAADLATLQLGVAVPDAAVLRTAAAPPAPGAAWSAPGFPQFQGGQQFTPHGTLQHGPPGDPSGALQLHLVQGTTDVAWEGASGSPVLVDDAVVGVVTRVTEGVATAWGTETGSLRQIVAISVLRRLLVAAYPSRNDLETACAALDGLAADLPADAAVRDVAEIVARRALRSAALLERLRTRLLADTPEGPERDRVTQTLDVIPAPAHTPSRGARAPQSLEWAWYPAVAVVALVSGIVAFFFGKTTYYAVAWTYTRDSIVAIGRLRRGGEKGRYSTYRFTQQFGRIIAIERVNGRGTQLPVYPSGLTPPEDMAPEDSSSRVRGDVLRLTPVYEGGALIRMEAHNRNGTLVWKDAVGDGRRRHQDVSGLPLSLSGDDLPEIQESGSDATGVKIEADASGFAEAERYENANGYQRPMPGGYYGIHWIRDAQGRERSKLYVDGDDHAIALRNGEAKRVYEYGPTSEIVREDAFGADGARTLDTSGTHDLVLKRDPQGNCTEREVHDAAGAVSPDYSGVARRLFEYDGEGLIRRIRYVDKDGKPAASTEGWAQIELDYDERGFERFRAYFDTSGNATPTKDGYARVERSYDAVGNETERRFFDRNGRPTSHADGFTAVRYQYDERGYLKQVSYHDANGEPYLIRKGYALYELKVDALGHETEWAAFLAPEKPTLHNGYSYLKKEYDKQGRRTREAYFDDKGRATTRIDSGIAGEEFEYDGSGNLISRRFRDPDNNSAVTVPWGYAKTVSEYDARGLVTDESFFDADDRPVSARQSSRDGGCARYHYTLDRSGNRAESVCLRWDGKDPVGSRNGVVHYTYRPAPNGDGITRIHREHDARGAVTREEYYDKDDKRVLSLFEKVWAMDLRYDPRGNLIETRHYGADGQLALCVHRNAGQRYEYNDRGNETSTINLGLDLKPTDLAFDPPSKSVMHAHLVHRFDEKGRMIAEEYFDAQGHKAVDDDGVCGTIITYDDRGNEASAASVGSNGSLVQSRFGWARLVKLYDDHGRRIGSTYVGADGKTPMLGVEGFASWKNELDERGNAVKKTYYDEHGRVHEKADGIAYSTSEYDTSGRFTSESYFDHTGKRVANNDGAARVVVSYDPRGQRERMLYFGPDDQPLHGVAEVQYTYDAAGREIKEVYLDPHGHLAMNGRGIAQVLSHYDNRGLLDNTMSLDASSKAAHGSPHEHNAYDESGRLWETTWADDDGRPALNDRGSAVVQLYYDAMGRMSEKWFLGKDRKKKLIDIGYARRTVAYDARSNPQDDRYFDAQDDPVLRTDAGYAHRRRTYDLRNFLTGVAFFGKDDSLVLSKHGFARIALKYDDAGNQTETALFDAGDRPLPPFPVALVDDDHAGSFRKSTRGVREGFVVTSLDPDGAAAREGVRLGDVVLNYDGEPIAKDSKGLKALAAEADRATGVKKKLVLLRWHAGELEELVKTLGDAPLGFKWSPAVVLNPGE